MINAILWDMDGVLVNTAQLHFIAWKQTLLKEGINIIQSEFDETLGMNNHLIIKKLVKMPIETSKEEKIVFNKEIYFRNHLNQINLLPGVKHCLSYFYAIGKGQAIASSAPKLNIQTIADKLEISQYFQAMISGADLPGKPDPATFLAAANKLGVLPDECLVIEDSIHGITAAKKCNMHVLAVTTSFTKSDLKNADFVIDDFKKWFNGNFFPFCFS